MLRNVFMLMLAIIIAVPAWNAPIHAATTCTVNYYYTSSENPEGIPAPSTGTLGKDGWKITPAVLTKTVYTKTAGSKRMTYTFKGWYTNINCIGKKYAPGVETRLLTPSAEDGRYSISLYGKWVYSEKIIKTEKQMPETTIVTAQSSVPETAVSDTTAAQKPDETTTVPKTSAPADQKITSVSTYTFADTGETKSLEARASSGLALQYSSSRPSVVSVDKGGIMKAKGPGTAAITITQRGSTKYKPVSRTIQVKVPSFQSREAALAPWKHILIDTFFHINDRKYSFSKPGKYWKDSKGNWSGKTGRSGRTQSCITLPTVSLKRTGIVSSKCGNIWLSSNMASTPNKTVRRLKRDSSMLKITYPHKSLRRLSRKGDVRYGDIVCRSGHTFIYMGRNENGRPLIFDGGTQRNIGNGTKVIWGRHDRLTGKVKRQIKKSNAQGEKWKRGELSDASFKGHTASGKNLHNSIHIVCSINTFTVKTNCVNGTISLGNNYMAGQDVRVNYAPASGRKLDCVQVDGKKVSKSKYRSGYTFRSIGENHFIKVVYR